jgi:quinohemoprotein ethanol dehydrogenase
LKRTITDISTVTGVAALTVVALIAGCSTEPTDVPSADTTPPLTPTVALVDDERIRNAAVNEPGSWLAYGQTFEEQRFSGLTQINRETVTDLGLAWSKPLGERHRVETTPLVIDGVMYISDPWNVTYALDAVTGEEIWVFDPETDKEMVRYACCGGPMTRGVAVYQGRVYIATFDGRMVAVDAATGQKVWDVSTQHPSSVSPFTVTGAPRAGGGKVYIGQSSSEFGVRGYVSAYDAETGDLAWRFYLVPGDPSQPFEHPELEMAAETWDGEWWTLGAGGTVWSSIVYDPDLHTVYLGVGNGAPWPRDIRSPGRGDNLFLTAVVAVDPDTGRMKWYYQQVPGDNWDYSAAMQMTLADMEVDGTMRKVLLQAPKNGFFYVLGREDGELLRAHPYGRITWATHVDMETGRPVENTDVYYEENPQWIFPGAGGTHNWQPMSFDADQGVMYIPTHDTASFFGLPEEFAKTGIFKMREVGMTTGLPIGAYRDQLVAAAAPEPESRAYLKKFDPLSGETLWAIENEGNRPSGVLATAGGLIFQSDGQAGYISAYNTDNGETLWRTEVPGARFGPGPISYEIDGTQYIAITSGVDLDYEGEGKLFVFKLGGDMAMPLAPALLDMTIPEPPPLTGSANDLARGDQLYHAVCANCHGPLGQELQSGTRVADLRRMSPETHENYQTIVLGGSLEDLGMRSFANELNEEEVEAIRQFVISRANLAREEEAQ